ncbi:MAG TPA: 30S ribosomal protein S16 [Ignavibacteria bacterium]|nr:30S ribosomal protein S16 [Ignavibacteria bacterium]HMR00090.1 30S ribosomal protein S16 [Ignavibacteria bacterium]
MVKLRLRRMGRKKAPIYKIVAADSRSRRDGKFIEAVGQYDPNVHPAKLELVEERALYWLKAGALPTVTVRNLLSNKGLMLKLHLSKKGADEAKIAAEVSKWESMQESKLQRMNDKKLRRKEKLKKAAEKPAETTATTPAAEQPAAEEQSA